MAAISRRAATLAALFCVLLAPAHAQRGADNININGQLILAARAGLTQRVAQLLSEGAQVNSRDRNGDSPLNMAASRGNVALVDVICKPR